MNEKILVTGGTGLVGKALNRILPGASYMHSRQFNLTIQSDVERMFRFYNPTVVVHLAAKVGGIQDNINNPASYFDDNILMNTLMLQASYKYRVNQFITTLSTCIYPDTATSYPLKESQLHDDKPTESNFSYGIAKRAMATQIDAYNKQYGTKYSYLIPCNLYGTNDKYEEGKSHFVAALVRKIYEAKQRGDSDITLMGTGKPLRQFMHADDLARVILECIYYDINTSMNVCNDEIYTIDQIARIALKACNAEHLNIIYDETKPDGQFRKDCDNSILKGLIPEFNFIDSKFKFTDLYTGIKETYLSYAKV